MWCWLAFVARAGSWVSAEAPPPGELLEWHGLSGAAGHDLGCAVRPDHTVACFDGAAPVSTGLPAGPLRDWVFGWTVACGLDAAGLLQCGVPERKARKTLAVPTEPLVAFDLAGSGVCGIRKSDGGVVCVGAPPTWQVSKAAWTTLSCASYACCGIRTDGAPECFGDAGFVADPVPAGTFRDVATDGSSACAVRADGALVCWGSSSDTPQDIGPGPFVSVDHGYVARRADGSAFVAYASWYSHVGKELGPVRWADRTRATDPEGRPFVHTSTGLGPVPAGPMVDVDAGLSAVCAVGADTRIHCFGDDVFVVGHAPDDSGYVEISVANNSACARRGDGTVRCWGKPDWVADPDAAFSSLLPGGPARTAGADAQAPSVVFTSLADGSTRCGTTTDGVVCWDRTGIHRSPATKVAERVGKGCTWTTGWVRCGAIDALLAGEGDLQDVSRPIDVAAGYEHWCVLGESGVTCSGRDVSGETSPPPGPFRQLALAEKRSCGLRPDGTVVCWGGSPRPAPEGAFVDLAVTQETDLQMATFVCGIRATDRQLVCWPY